MTKTTDSLRQYVDLRAALERERTALQQRLQQIEEVLGNGRRGPGRPPANRAPAAPAAKPAPAAKAKAAPAKKSPAGGPRTGPSMREVIAKLVAKSPMRINDIVVGMQRSGYVFKSSNPTNSVGAYLYGPEGKKHFTRADGKFSPKK